MNRASRKLAFSVATVCVALALGATPALAATHHKHHAKKHHATAHHTTGAVVIRIAQTHLSNLGYYHGKIDGIMGPKTRAAIKQFQREHSLKVDGILGPKTNRALEVADPSMDKTPAGGMTMRDLPPPSDLPVNPDYTLPLNGGTKTIPSRYAQLDISENGGGGDRRYNVNLNGQPILIVEGQPSIIGISPTYDLTDEQAIVFTTYAPNDHDCPYKNHVLALNDTGTRMLDIANCTRAYQASVNNGVLYVAFPERDDNRDVGATWRLEGLNLEKL